MSEKNEYQDIIFLVLFVPDRTTRSVAVRLYLANNFNSMVMFALADGRLSGTSEAEDPFPSLLPVPMGIFGPFDYRTILKLYIRVKNFQLSK